MISILLMVLVGVCNAVMDVLFTRYDKSIFTKFNPEWWNPQISWKWKWDMPLHPSPHYWYYFGFYPAYAERFPYSSTIFVWVTDAWHFFKALMIGFCCLAIVYYEPCLGTFWDFVLCYCAWTFTFTMCYDYLFIKDEEPAA
jgi:hypothetical protein